MRIAFVMQAFCARRHKFYELLKDHYDIELFCLWKQRTDVDAPEKLQICKNQANLLSKVKKGDFDVVHVFTDYTELAYKLMQKEKIVIDTYDIADMRGAGDNFAEAVYTSKWPKVFSSRMHLNYLKEKYGWEGRDWVIPNLPLKKWIENIRPLKKLPGENVIYYGGITLATNNYYGYRFYAKQFQELAAAGITVHIYPANTSKPLKAYERKNIILHSKIPHQNLFQELTKYQVGFLGYNDKLVKQKPVEYAKTCLPNKAFDYMMAGIPSLSYNLGYAEKYVKHWGVCCSNKDDLVAGYYEAKKLNLEEIKKEDFYLDNFLDSFKEIYNLANSL